MKKYLVSAAVVAALVSGPALAFDDSDRAAVKGVLDKLIEDLQSGNYADVFTAMPPGLIEKMAEPTGMDAQAFTTVMVQQLGAAMQQLEIQEVSYDLDGMQTATSSADRDYAIVSTSTVMKMGTETVKAIGPAVAFEDEDKWYVLQIQSPDQAALLGSLYPDLAGIDVPAASIAPLE